MTINKLSSLIPGAWYFIELKNNSFIGKYRYPMSEFYYRDHGFLCTNEKTLKRLPDNTAFKAIKLEVPDNCNVLNYLQVNYPEYFL